VAGNKVADFSAELAASFFYLGYVPACPGTVGAAAGLAWWLILRRWAPGLVPTHPADLGWAAGAFLALFFLGGVWASGRAARSARREDPAFVVIDEVFSVFITFFALGVRHPAWWLLGLGFLLNRVFDIVKPWPLRQLERLPGGWGIMLDDLGAGILSNLALRLILLF